MEAAERAKRPYPLVLLDASMPVMDGFDLAPKIQQSPRLAGASIMMLSSGARPGDGPAASSSGSPRTSRSPSSSPTSWTRSWASSLPGRRERSTGRGRARRREPKGARRLRVLVAEDNAVNQQVAVGMLERAGHEAIVAENGREVARPPREGDVRRGAHGRADARAWTASRRRPRSASASARPAATSRSSRSPRTR